MKIYTKTGDGGETALFGGQRLPKSHVRIEAYGTVDELNAYVGLVRDSVADEQVRELLVRVQNGLFAIGAKLATEPGKGLQTPDIPAEVIEQLEAAMDEMEAVLPLLKNFILPGGHMAVSFCHVARCVCRRAERRVVALGVSDDEQALAVRYLNRLSDYFFVLSRYVGQQLGVVDTPWMPNPK